MSRKLSIRLSKVFIIIVCWLFVGLLLTLYDHFLLHSELAAGYSSNYSFNKNLAFNLSAALLGASLGSLWLVFYVNEKLREKTYGYTLGMVALSFLVIVVLIAFTLGMFFVKFETGYWPLSNTAATEELLKNLSNPFHLKNIVVWANIVLLTQLGLQVNDKFGQGLFLAFIKGRYHSPKKEKRVFMFVDLIGSTSMAERLGNEKYYNLLKDFFADITDSIVYNGGKIYQYVGDEVVISWDCEEKTPRADFLNCYFDMRKVINENEDKYRGRYGILPDFKAAIHYGEVTVGEIGIIKKDLTFSGDVLNTTSRIMAFCKEYGRKLLISEKLFHYLAAVDEHFEFEKMGEELLRGKSEKTKIYTVLEK
jgi:adenylate cyclase